MKQKNIMLIVTIISILLITVTGTFAYWYYRGINKDITLVTGIGINSDDIIYNVGESYFIGDFQPTMSFCQSISTTLSFRKTNKAANNMLSATINMDVNDIGDNIAMSNDVYWVITSGNNAITCDNGLTSSSVVDYGTFKGVKPGDTIKLLSDIEVTLTEQVFTVWIWIDEMGSSLDTLVGETVDANIWTEIALISSMQPNAPVLDDGMIPITIDENGDAYTVDRNDPSWYHYDYKEWANVVLVNETATEGVTGSQPRSYYQSNMNVKVNESDILAYYVWIPRYKYRIPYTKCSDIPEAERSLEAYPECYAPYTMSDADKDKLAVYYEGETSCNETDEYIAYSLDAVNYALENGKFSNAEYQAGFEFYIRTSIVSWVEAYNNGVKKLCGSFEEADLTLIPSSFNGNNKLMGAGNEVSIDIEFEAADAAMSKGDAVNTYYTHPSFWWDDNSNGLVNAGETIAGIWVGKFETTPDKSSACYTTSNETNCNNSTQNPTILPNESPLVYQDIGNQFATSQNLTKTDNIYGLSNSITDGHMMKNSDWGAVAYLSHSKYGINQEVVKNNYYVSSKTKTGCGQLEETGGGSSTCIKAYGTDGLTEYPQSTTGNVTGIFDMSGGAWDNVMGNYNNTPSFAYFPILPNSKYYDVYLSGPLGGYSYSNMTFCTLETCGGHALIETTGWYNNSTTFIDSDYIWFKRGGDIYKYGAIDDNIFSFQTTNGASYSWDTWRSVLIVK